MKIQFIATLFFLFIASGTEALEIDEKLTLRFLKVSSTKKTVLINRGGEDGLVVGDHAKFFITAGVVARGVAEKVSPSRSIWSLYRVVDTNEITEDKVLNLKIATPVKITEDPTKSMKEEVPAGSESISINDKAPMGDSSEKEIIVDEADQAELESIGIEAPAERPKKTTYAGKGEQNKSAEELELPSSTATNKSKNWEVWGLLYLNSLSGTTDTEGTTTDASSSLLDFSAGIEKYFLTSKGFLGDLSFSIFLHKRSTETGSDVSLTSEWSEYGAGANYHFHNNAYDLNRPVLFGSFTLGKGSESHESQVSGIANSPEDGQSTFFSLGVGAKYVLNSGFGARAIFDYYSSKETYTFSDGSESTRSLAGPRMQFGISYRF